MNKKIVIAAVVVGASGVVNAITNSKPLTPVILGSYIFVLVLAVTDMFGPPLSDIAGALAMLAVVYVLIVEFPWNAILNALKGGSTSNLPPAPNVGGFTQTPGNQYG